MKNAKYVTFLSGLAVFITGCNQMQVKRDPGATASVSHSYEVAKSTLTAPEYDSGYITVVKSNNSWSIQSVSKDRPARLAGTEIISFPKWEIAYEEASYYKKIGTGFFHCELRNSNDKYTPCDSELTSFYNTDFFFVFGGNRYSIKSNEFQKLLTDISKSPVVLAIKDRELKAKNKQELLAKYRSNFKEMGASLVKINKFINTYQGNDPDNLVPKAIVQFNKYDAYKKELSNAVASTMSPDSMLKKMTPANPLNYCNIYQESSENKLVCKDIAPEYINMTSRRITVAKWSAEICSKVASKRISSAGSKCREWAAEPKSRSKCDAKLSNDTCDILYMRDQLNILDYDWTRVSMTGSIAN